MATEPTGTSGVARASLTDALVQQLRELRQVTSEAQHLAVDLASEVEEHKREVLMRSLGRDDLLRDQGGASALDRMLEKGRRLDELADAMKENVRTLHHDLVRQVNAQLSGVPLPDEGQEPRDLRALLEEYERRIIVSALEASGMRQNAAARMLGILPTTLNEKLKRLGLREAFSSSSSRAAE